jgi:hypothetical protein
MSVFFLKNGLNFVSIFFYLVLSEPSGGIMLYTLTPSKNLSFLCIGFWAAKQKATATSIPMWAHTIVLTGPDENANSHYFSV